MPDNPALFLGAKKLVSVSIASQRKRQ